MEKESRGMETMTTMAGKHIADQYSRPPDGEGGKQ